MEDKKLEFIDWKNIKKFLVWKITILFLRLGELAEEIL